MHPVSQRGRSMPHDRQSIRAFLMFAGILCWSLSTGCLRPSILRPDTGPATNSAAASESTTNTRSSSSEPAMPLAAATNAPSAPVPSPAAASPPPAPLAMSPPTDVQSALIPADNQTPLAPVSPQPASNNPPSLVPVNETPAGNDKTTPLLDAALERVASVRESIDSSVPHSDPEVGAKQQVATARTPAATAGHEHPSLLPPPAPGPVADITATLPARTPAVINVSDPPAPPAHPAGSKDATPQAAADTQPKERPDAGARADAPAWEVTRTLLDNEPAASAAPATADSGDPLGIGKICLCRKIVGFGTFEPLNESQVKVGKRILLYCEMNGMQYEAKDASFVSRLLSKIEISSVHDGSLQWTYLFGPKEDICGSHRHDYFVCYRFLPQTLAPGSYRLRLTQTDMVANRSVSAEIPLEIVR
jgi:hypothetical protein